MKIGISLCGGGARGWAHIGVLRALEENNISPQYISGASAGAIVGTMYASGKTPAEMLEISKDASIFKVALGGLIDIAMMPTSGITRLSYLREILEQHLPQPFEFEQLEKQMFISVTNLNECNYEVIQSGNIIDAVTASAAIPIIFKPQPIGDNMYVDGGLVNNLPVEPLKSICDLVIGVNVNNNLYEAEVNNVLEIAQRSFEIILWNNTKDRLRQCDIVIEPEPIFEYGLFDFGKIEDIVQYAYECTKIQMPNIRAKIKEMELHVG